MRGRLRGGVSAWGLGCGQWGGQGGLGVEWANWGVGSGCLGRGRLRKGGKCLGWSGWSRGREGELGSGLRLLGARVFEKGGQVPGVDRVVSGPRGQTREWA